MKHGGLVELLSVSLGMERSESLVRGAMVRLGLTEPGDGGARELEAGQVEQILEAIGAAGGMASVAARFARQKARSLSVRHPLERIPAAVIADLLAPTLGEQRSVEVLAEALDGDRDLERGLDRQEAFRVLAVLAARPGILGVAARFARTSVTNWFE